MQWFVEASESVDRLTNADTLMRSDPDYYRPRFEAIKALREADDGTLHRGNEFRRVASLVNVPMFSVVNLLDPEWMKNKARFYRWLARHPEYKTYEKKGGSRLSETYMNGKPVMEAW